MRAFTKRGREYPEGVRIGGSQSVGGTSGGWRTHTEDLRGDRDVRDSGQHVDDHAILWEAMIYLSRHVAKIEAMLDEGEDE